MKTRLLIAEVDEQLREVYRRFFKVKGFDVEIVAGGPEYMQAVQANPPDVAVVKCDILRDVENIADDGRARMGPATNVDVIVITHGCDGSRLLGDGSARIVGHFQEPFGLYPLLESVKEASRLTDTADTPPNRLVVASCK